MYRSLVVCIGLFLLAPLSQAHIDDEVRQAYATMKIEDDGLQMIITLPARYAFPVVFEGASPIEMDKLEPAEMLKRLEPALAGLNEVTIDGVKVRPTILAPKIDMINSRLPARSFIEPQIMKYGEFNYVALYETKSKPRRVSILWNALVPEYDDQGEPVADGETSPVPVTLRAYGKQQLVIFKQDEPEHIWHSEASASVPADLLVAQHTEHRGYAVPVASLGVLLVGLVLGFGAYRKSHTVGIASVLGSVLLALLLLPVGRVAFDRTPTYAVPADAEAIELFRSLHANIYRAFDYTDESAVYDALAQSVDGPMLETIYNDIYQSLIMREEGGAVSKVTKVEMRSAEVLESSDTSKNPTPEPGVYRVRAKWTVDGLVQHHGHTHGRTNAFEAVYTLAPRGGAWRIVDAQILDQQRVDDGQQGL